MFSSKKREDTVTGGIDTLIGINSLFEGNIESDGTVKVDGKVKGDLKVSGDLFVGNNAYVIGNITAHNIQISGSVEGNINAKGMLKLLSTAKLLGDIQVQSFVADEGGLFQGKCTMLEIQQSEKDLENTSSKKPHSSKDYKKSSVLGQFYDEKDKNPDFKED
jgi:cytoskeletal protein CcmA (bactofilin family)